LKHKLVPFGEYIPFRNWLNKFLDILHISDMSMTMSDFKPSNMKNKPMLADKIKISAFICYEIAFPEMVITHDSTINMLLTVTNDAWFGHSIAQAQHLEMAQMRALELERPLLYPMMG
jgi:apolipoprotein N-acyltransferase